MKATILVVDDEKNVRWTMREWLEMEGYRVQEAVDGATLRQVAAKGGIDLVLLDLTLPDVPGLVLLQELREQHPNLPVIIVTANATAETAVLALKQGAEDYVTKPFRMEQLLPRVAQAVAKGGDPLSGTSEEKRKQRFGVDNLIGDSPQLREIKALIKRVAAGNSTTVLLLGESGTGKDMVARALHYESRRVEKPFMNITCTALPETLMESELFGYEKGAFTNAFARKKGLFELANGGTVFMDEVGDMPPVLQAKLLRVLEDRSFKRIGGNEDVQVDVRIVAATNRDLLQRIEQGKFREDLYYRISTVPVVMPPLRERKTDIPLLAAHFLGIYNQEFRRSISPLSEAVLEKLQSYPWPGNVRELRNVMERAILLASGTELSPDDVVLGRFTFSKGATAGAHTVTLPEHGCTLEDVERSLIAQALERSEGNQTRAAELVGLTRDQIRYKMKKFDMG